MHGKATWFLWISLDGRLTNTFPLLPYHSIHLLSPTVHWHGGACGSLHVRGLWWSASTTALTWQESIALVAFNWPTQNLARGTSLVPECGCNKKLVCATEGGQIKIKLLFYCTLANHRFFRAEVNSPHNLKSSLMKHLQLREYASYIVLLFYNPFSSMLEEGFTRLQFHVCILQYHEWTMYPWKIEQGRGQRDECLSPIVGSNYVSLLLKLYLLMC